ncbi:hypothetical protein [Actinophytocola xinjiangensis]|uniref:hypothetical protein n=1 Tax=Actinophytocola xinjiangensis TaxID=485602 RepID=UPI0013906325|nr:hypothetical protein [Actinophytocola xinjiangensis]
MRNFYLVAVDDSDYLTEPRTRDHGVQDFHGRKTRNAVDRIVAVGMSFVRPCGEQHVVAHRPSLFGEQAVTAFFTTIDRAIMAFGHTTPVEVEWTGDWADDPYDPDAHTHDATRSSGASS